MDGRTDLYFENVKKNCDGNASYHVLSFSNVIHGTSIQKKLKKELQYFLDIAGIDLPAHVFIVGLGSDQYTADSVGAKALRYIHANAYLERLKIPLTNKISTLEPGVLGETGIETRRIIESVVEEIHPDVVLLIDSFVTQSAAYLNHTIEISNAGVTPGSGLKGLNQEINQDTLGVPVIVMGIPTAIEVKLSSHNKKDKRTYLLSTNDIDLYVDQIAKIIGTTIDEFFH